MLAFSLLLIIPFTALVFLLTEASSEVVRESIESSTSQTIEQYGSHLTTLLKQVEEIGNQTMSSSMTQMWITTLMNPDSAMEERHIAKQRLVDSLASYTINNSSGISIGVFSQYSGGIWTQDRTYAEQSWFRRFEAEDIRWTKAHYDSDQPDESMKSRLINSYMLPLVQLQSFTKVGFVKVNYPTNTLRDGLDKMAFGESGRAFLVEPDGGSVLEQPLTEEEQGIVKIGMDRIAERVNGSPEGFFSIDEAGEPYLLFYRYFPDQDWYVVGAVPERELFIKIDDIKRTLLLIALGLLVMAILLAFWLSYGITKPLTAMARAMKYVERGEFKQALAIMPNVRKGHSEVGFVTRVFDSMTNRLQYLIETEFETNLRRKNAEYKALLLQINPHFFNNTLEIIGGLAAMKRNDVVMDATEALGQMMRYSLNLNSDLVKVKEEMAYIRDYLFILQLRYEDRLDVDIEEDLASGGLLIAKFLLQPIVENAVKYSLEKSGIAKVSIAVRKAEERLQLRVADNGIGMSGAYVEELLEVVNGSDTADILNSGGDSIGLRNVLSRCRLYYGAELNVSIHSVVGEGTAIELHIPAVKG